jgi:hypothetical protein
MRWAAGCCKSSLLAEQQDQLLVLFVIIAAECKVILDLQPGTVRHAVV